MEKRATANLDTRYTAFPTDFLEPIRLMITGTSETRLELITLSELMDKRAVSNTAATPKFYIMKELMLLIAVTQLTGL